ncbi:MAG: hypothetical protein V3T05_07865 [Myxococcota bacterium]
MLVAWPLRISVLVVVAQPAGPTVTRTADGRSATTSEPNRRKLTVLFSNDMYGRFRRITCDEPGAEVIDFANLVGAADAVRAEVERRGDPPPIFINNGDNIGPKAMARFLLAHGDEGGRRIAAWFARAGFDVVGIGNNDLASAPGRLKSYLTAGRAAGVWFSAANLDCKGDDVALCELLRPEGKRYRMIERGGLRIAIFSVVHGDLRDTVPSTHLPGISVADPLERAREVSAEARQDGADLVFVLAHLDHPSTAPRNAVELARDNPGLDLVVGSALHAYDGRGLVLLRFADHSTPIVGSDSYAQQLGRVNLSLVLLEGRWRVETIDAQLIPTAGAEPEAGIRKDLEVTHRSYCDEWDEPVGGGRLPQPMTATGFANYLMAVMRWETRSEVAFVHRGMIQPLGVFPVVDSLTRHHFFAGLPRRNHLYTFEIEGSALTAICGQLPRATAPPAKSDLLALGLECGSSKKINGRPIVADEKYSAVTIEYLTQGSMGYLFARSGSMELFNPNQAAEAPILGAIARDYLSGPQFSGADPAPIDHEKNFPDLSRELRWTFQGDIDLNVADTSLRPKGFRQRESQLDRAVLLALRGEVRGHVAAESRLHGLSVDVRMKFAGTMTEVRDENGDLLEKKLENFEESDDLDTFDLLYRFHGLAAGASSWWAPIPYASGKVETELTVRDDPDAPGENLPRHLELTGTLGARFKFLPELEAKIGVGVRDEISSADDDPPAALGLEIGYELQRKSLLTVFGSPLKVESKLSVFSSSDTRAEDACGPKDDHVNGSEDQRIRCYTLKGTWTSRIYFPLFGGLNFNITHDLFFFQQARAPSDLAWGRVGLASQLTAGLSYHAGASLQTF